MLMVEDIEKHAKLRSFRVNNTDFMDFSHACRYLGNIEDEAKRRVLPLRPAQTHVLVLMA